MTGLPTLPFAVPRWAWVALGVLAALVAFYFVLDAYGDSRYREGVTAEREAWKEAERKLLAKAANATTKADKQADARAAEYAATVADERKKVNEAVSEGSSPFDVLFNGS